MTRPGPRPVCLLAPSTPAQWAIARRLVEDYAATLDVDLAFQGLAVELEQLAQTYAAPDGAFLIATVDDEPAGCVGLRRFADGAAEVKRLYVAPSARGLRLGRQLAQAIVAQARALGYARLLLDTLPSMTAAQALYRSLGFRPIPPYRFNPVPGTVYLALALGGHVAGGQVADGPEPDRTLPG